MALVLSSSLLLVALVRSHGGNGPVQGRVLLLHPDLLLGPAAGVLHHLLDLDLEEFDLAVLKTQTMIGCVIAPL